MSQSSVSALWDMPVAVERKCPLGYAGVEHEEVRLDPETVHIFHQRVDGFTAFEVHFLVPGLYPVLAAAFLHFSQLLLTEAGEYHICSSLCELVGDGLAYARTPARYQQGLVLELYHIRFLISTYKLTQNTVTLFHFILHPFSGR